MIGFRYVDGDGVEQDSKEAVRWFKLAAGQGNADAQAALGVMYGDGVGVAKDGNTAKHCAKPLSQNMSP